MTGRSFCSFLAALSIAASGFIAHADELTPEQRAKFLPLAKCPPVKTIQMQFIKHRLKPDAQPASEAEIQTQIDEQFQRFLKERGDAKSTAQRDNEARAMIEASVRASAIAKYDQTLHMSTALQDKQYLLRINRKVDRANLQDTYDETHINCGDLEKGNQTYYSIDLATQCVWIEKGGGASIEGNYGYFGHPLSAQFLWHITPPEERKDLLVGCAAAMMESVAASEADLAVTSDMGVQWEGKSVDHFKAANEKDQLALEYYFDSSDYRKMYYEKALMGNQLMYENRYDDYRQEESLGTLFPYHAKLIMPDETNLKTNQVVTVDVLSATFNKEIPEEVFNYETYRTPEMKVIDARQGQPRLIEPQP